LPRLHLFFEIIKTEKTNLKMDISLFLSFLLGIPLKFEAAGFGEVKLFGRKYDKDVVVHADGSVTKRKKKKSKDLKSLYGHTPLSERELDFLEDEKPAVVYVGVGYDGALPITEEAKKTLSQYHPVILATPEVVEKLKDEKRNYVAIIHVTC
jgi:hypothetical protein